jgi:rod shape-determining protein MreD
MTYLLYAGTILILLILQTTIMPYIGVLGGFYDLPSVFVLYLGLFRSLLESVPVVVVLGLVMDNLSGGSLGLYLSTYLWLYAGIRWLITVVNVRDNILLPFVVAAGVLLENIIFMGTIAMLEPGSRFSRAAFGTVFVQMLWAASTGPIFLLLYNYLHQKWENYFKEIFAPLQK